MKSLPQSVKMYLALVTLAAAGIMAWSLTVQGLPATSEIPLAALLGACMLLAWLYPLPVGFKMHFYLDTAVLLAAALLFEPGTAMLIVGVGTLLAQRIRRRFWDEAIFNCGQTMLQTAVVALPLGLAGYKPGSIEAGSPGYIVSVLVAGIILYLTSALLVGMIVALQGGENPLFVWADSIFKADDAVYLAQIGLAIVVAVLGSTQYWTIALLIPLVAVVYGALDHGMALRRRAEMALRLQEKSLTEAQRLARIGSWEWDLSNGAQGWSEESFRLLGFTPPFPEPGLEILLERVHPDDREVLDGRIHAAIRYQSNFDLEHRVIQPDGRELTVHHRGEIIHDDIEGRSRVVAMIHDISERRVLEGKLEHLAFHDALTGLPNRTRLIDEIEATLEQSRRGGREFALLFVDLDGFKAVNDSFGHRAGDEVLIEFGRRLSDNVREADIVARYGGDEFVVLARSVRRADEAEKLASRVLASLADPVKLTNGAPVTATASIGIIMSDSRVISTNELLQRVDAALYQAKRNGKDTYAIYSAGKEHGILL